MFYFIAVTVANGLIYIVSSNDGSLEIYDPQLNKWTLFPNIVWVTTNKVPINIFALSPTSGLNAENILNAYSGLIIQ